MIPINFWKSTEGQYSEKSWDKPCYSSEPNTAPDESDYFTIRKEFSSPDGDTVSVSKKQVTLIRDYLLFKGDVRESTSGESWRVFRNNITNTFDMSAITG